MYFFTIPRGNHENLSGTLVGKLYLKTWLSAIDRIQHLYLISLDWNPSCYPWTDISSVYVNQQKVFYNFSFTNARSRSFCILSMPQTKVNVNK